MCIAISHHVTKQKLTKLPNLMTTDISFYGIREDNVEQNISLQGSSYSPVLAEVDSGLVVI